VEERRVADIERGGGVPAAASVHAVWLSERPALATGFIAATASTLALGSTLIRFAYDAGAGTLTVVMVRTTIAAVVLALVLALRGVRFRFSPRERWATPLIGVFLASYSVAMYMGMEYMPVALVILTFYTYPLFTGLFTWLTGQEKFGVAGLIALPLAFLGLLLALDISGGGFNLVGAGWAVLGALGFSTVLVLSARLFPRVADTRPRTCVMLAISAALTTIAAVASGNLWFPTTALGWAALLGSSLCYVVGMTAVLFAASVLGPARVALVMNVEPVSSLILTFLILGDRLRPFQLAGAALVITAIFLFRPRPAARRGISVLRRT
jgi:drug/metabolite transporter (DMT)-like permease